MTYLCLYIRFRQEAQKATSCYIQLQQNLFEGGPVAGFGMPAQKREELHQDMTVNNKSQHDDAMALCVGGVCVCGCEGSAVCAN